MLKSIQAGIIFYKVFRITKHSKAPFKGKYARHPALSFILFCFYSNTTFNKSTFPTNTAATDKPSQALSKEITQSRLALLDWSIFDLLLFS